jgi:hypothetical protein
MKTHYFHMSAFRLRVKGVCITFYVKLGKSATETLEMLREAFGEIFVSRTSAFEWHLRFKTGRVSF